MEISLPPRNVLISPIKAILPYLNAPDVDYILCTSEPLPPFNAGKNVLLLRFADVTDGKCQDAFQPWQAEAVCNFLRHTPSANDLFLCCDSGESRSAAIAAAILLAQGQSDLQIWDGSEYHPNELVFKIQCAMLGVDINENEIQTRKRLNNRAFQRMKGAKDMENTERLSAMLDKALRERYGENAPEEIRTRANEEMEQIKANGWEDDFLRAYQITRRLHQAEVPYLLPGAEGGNSFVAYLLGITQVNPLPPHYYCPKCRRIEFVPEVKDGFDLSEKACGTCGAAMRGDGHQLDSLIGTQSLFGEYRLPTCGVPLVHEALSLCCPLTPFSRKWMGAEEYKLDGWFLAPPEQFENAVWVDAYIPLESKKSVKTVLWDAYDPWHEVPHITLTTGGYVERLHWLCEKTGVKEEVISAHDSAALKGLFAALGDDCLADTNLAVTTGLYNFKGPFGKEKEELFKRELRLKAAKEMPCFSNLVRFQGVRHMTADEKMPHGICMTLCDRDSLLEFLKQHGATQETALFLTEKIGKGRFKRYSAEIKAQLETLSVDTRTKAAIEQIGYLFPRAHDVSFGAVYVRLAWFSLHYPDEYREALTLF